MVLLRLRNFLQGFIDMAQWSKRQLKIARKLADPNEPESLPRLARATRVPQEKIELWLKNPDFVQLVNDRVDEFRKAERRKIWRTVIQKAKGGSAADRKLYFELSGELVKRSKSIPSGSLEGMSEDEIDDRIKDLTEDQSQ